MRTMQGFLIAIAAAMSLTAADAQTPGAAGLSLTPAEMADLPTIALGAGTSGLAGTRTIVLSGNPNSDGPYTIALIVPPHTRIAAHRHRDDRSAVVVSGTWQIGFGSFANDPALRSLPPGSFYTEPAGVMHFARTGDQPVTIYIFGYGPTDTVYPRP